MLKGLQIKQNTESKWGYQKYLHIVDNIYMGVYTTYAIETATQEVNYVDFKFRSHRLQLIIYFLRRNKL